MCFLLKIQSKIKVGSLLLTKAFKYDQMGPYGGSILVISLSIILFYYIYVIIIVNDKIQLILTSLIMEFKKMCSTVV